MKEVVLITYTTRYRKGGSQFKRVAHTMAQALGGEASGVICRPVESKAALMDLFDEIGQSNHQIKAFHFIGHSGMYGPMFGTVSYPEQFSPYELKQLKIPFTEEAQAYFHCCRSARWFAPFFCQCPKCYSSWLPLVHYIFCKKTSLSIAIDG